MKKQPWLKFYPADWRADASLRMCSPAARLLWLEILCLMHEAEPRGHLLVKGRRPTPAQIGMLSGITDGTVPVLLDELREAEVFDEIDGVIVSRKMVRDTKVSGEQAARVAKRWEKETPGNTVGITENVPQIPEARSQNIRAAAAGDAASDWPSSDARELSAILVAEAHTVKLDPSRQPGLVTSAGRIAAWQRQGFSWTDAVIPTVVALAQRAGRPLTSWSYFDSAIAERHALNTRPIPEAEIDHDQQPARRGTSQADHHAARRRGALAFLDEQQSDS